LSAVETPSERRVQKGMIVTEEPQPDRVLELVVFSLNEG
jgi:hypothetical protein